MIFYPAIGDFEAEGVDSYHGRDLLGRPGSPYELPLVVVVDGKWSARDYV
jgi:hypothetical protein